MEYKLHPLSPVQLRILEIEITTKCNLHCVHCDRRCSQALSDEEMSIGQIESFVVESLAHKYPWKHIHILGGEPALHSNLPQVLKTLQRLEGVDLEVITNGYGVAKDIASQLPPGVRLQDTAKVSTLQPQFIRIDTTMTEKGVVLVKSCDHPSVCGLGLSRYGFFPCGPGASIDRVLGLDVGIKSIAQLTPEAILEQQKKLCQYCGWSETRFNHPQPRFGEISSFWRKAYDAYRASPKPMRLYGAE
jgi:hypothetical protein